jgi:hypothetical protein
MPRHLREGHLAVEVRDARAVPHRFDRDPVSVVPPAAVHCAEPTLAEHRSPPIRLPLQLREGHPEHCAISTTPGCVFLSRTRRRGGDAHAKQYLFLRLFSFFLKTDVCRKDLLRRITV